MTTDLQAINERWQRLAAMSDARDKYEDLRSVLLGMDMPSLLAEVERLEAALAAAEDRCIDLDMQLGQVRRQHTVTGRPKVVTICGSTRFRDEIAEANRALTLAGYIVLAPGVFGHAGDDMTEEQKASLDALHFQKIDLSGGIYVVNPGGYVGESTQREIEYARRKGKDILAVVNLDVPGDA